MYKFLLLFFVFIAVKATAQVQQYAPNDTLLCYDVKYMKLNLECMDTSVFIKGSASLTIDIVKDTKKLMFDFEDNMHVDSVLIDDKKKNFVRGNNHIVINFQQSLTAGSAAVVKVFYNGFPENGLLYRGYITGYPTISVISESYLLRCWLPCKQVLADKIDSADINITTQNNLQAYSNGVLQKTMLLPDHKKMYCWHTAYPMAYYLFSVGTGNYSVIKDSVQLSNGAVLPLLYYKYNNAAYKKFTHQQMEKIPAYMQLLDSLLGTYPFAKEKYGVGIAQIINESGMENQSMSVCYNFALWLNIHEMMHQWFGDMVTCSSFNDIFLNEGFGQYAELLGIQFLPSLFHADNPKEYLHGWHKSIVSLPGGSVFVPEKDTYVEKRIFDNRLTYNKGASLVHMLRYEIGNDSLFFAALKNYLHSYQYSVASVSDLKKSLLQTTGIDFTTFFSQWYYGEGYPTFATTFSQTRSTVHVTVNETVSKPLVTPFFGIKMEYLIKTNNGDTVITHNQTQQKESFNVVVNGIVQAVIADPNDWIIDGGDDDANAAGAFYTSTSNKIISITKQKTIL